MRNKIISIFLLLLVIGNLSLAQTSPDLNKLLVGHWIYDSTIHNKKKVKHYGKPGSDYVRITSDSMAVKMNDNVEKGKIKLKGNQIFAIDGDDETTLLSLWVEKVTPLQLIITNKNMGDEEPIKMYFTRKVIH
jgi:hypothetical protein